MAEGEFEGVPGLAGASSAVDEELAVFRKLVEQRKAGNELPFEKLLGVVDEGAFLLRQGALAEGFQHGALLKGIDGVAGSNEYPSFVVYPTVKTLLLPALLLSCVLSPVAPAQTCREVVRDASGRIVQTIERQKQVGGTERAVIRDASGRITGTATTQTTAGGSGRTAFRDASGRVSGTASTHGANSGTTSTTYRDASGRLTGSATTNQSTSSGSRTQFRDASGRLTGSESSYGNGTSTRRDASGRVTGASTGSGNCKTGTRLPMTPPSAKK